jgi:hypothetical protein
MYLTVVVLITRKPPDQTLRMVVSSTLETEMNTQEVEISKTELTTEDLDAVHGGVRICDTPQGAAFMKAFESASGCTLSAFGDHYIC